MLRGQYLTDFDFTGKRVRWINKTKEHEILNLFVENSDGQYSGRFFSSAETEIVYFDCVLQLKRDGEPVCLQQRNCETTLAGVSIFSPPITQTCNYLLSDLPQTDEFDVLMLIVSHDEAHYLAEGWPIIAYRHYMPTKLCIVATPNNKSDSIVFDHRGNLIGYTALLGLCMIQCGKRK